MWTTAALGTCCFRISLNSKDTSPGSACGWSWTNPRDWLIYGKLTEGECTVGYDALPRLFRSTRLSYGQTLLCVLLRDEFRRFEDEETRNEPAASSRKPRFLTMEGVLSTAY